MDAVQTIRQYGPDLKGYVLQHVRPTAPDGRPWTVTVRSLTPIAAQAPNQLVASSPDVQVDLTMTPPPGAPADRLTFHYDVIFHRLITHTAIVSLASDWRNGVVGGPPVVLGTMRDTQPAIVIDRSQGSWLRGFAALFGLGARHIAEGTDHLLFLLALLLPAPLVAAGKRWGGYAGGRAALRRIVKIVTAFTVGHSVTLLLGALGWARLPERVHRVGHRALDLRFRRPCARPDLPGQGDLHRGGLRPRARPGVRRDPDGVRLGPDHDGVERAGV